RVTGAELLFLDRKSRTIAHRLLHGIALMPDHHHRRRVRQPRSKIEHVIDDRPARGTMKDLDRRRLHASAETRRKDHHFQILLRHRYPSPRRMRSSVRPYRSYSRKIVSARAAES